MDDPEKMKKIIIFSIIGVVLIALILIITLVVMNNISASKNNLIIDGRKMKLTSDIFITDDMGNKYLMIEQIAPLLSYEFYIGEYGKSTVDRTKCYVEKKDKEVALLEMNSDEIYKLLLDKPDRLYEKYKTTLRVKRMDNDKLYISPQGLEKTFNVVYRYDSEKNVVSIQTLPYLVQEADKIAKRAGYTSLAPEFVNNKALLQGLMVVVKDKQNYGVISQNGTDIIGTRYQYVEFIEDTVQFLVKDNNKYGIFTQDGVTKMDISYEDIKVIDSTIGLYMVRKGGKYGVLKKDGTNLLYLNYDSIGIKDASLFPIENLRNPYVIMDKFIPVMQNGKWGFYGTDGSEILAPVNFSTLGCIATTSRDNTFQNVLIIPESEGVEGIVVGRTNTANQTTYGVYSLQLGMLVTTPNFSKIYRQIINDETTYYMLYGSEVVRVKDMILQNISTINDNNTQVNMDSYDPSLQYIENEKRLFNSQFENFSGLQTGANVKTLISKIVDSNSKNYNVKDRIININASQNPIPLQQATNIIFNNWNNELEAQSALTTFNSMATMFMQQINDGSRYNVILNINQATGLISEVIITASR